MRAMCLVLVAGAALAAPVAAPVAETVAVAARPGALQEAIAAARDGDDLRLAAGIHEGGVVIDKPITLDGQAGAVVDGGGKGNVITVSAPGVTVRGLLIRNSGASLSEMNSGVFVGQEGDGARIVGNRLEGNLFGVYLWGPENAEMRDNEVVGRDDLHMSERGNGVSVWNSPGSRVVGNSFRFGRDGIFTTTSRDNLFADNTFRDLRFAVHYMYTNDSEVSGNVSLGNHVGYALMYSRGITATGNLSRGDRDNGILLNFANDALIAGNAVLGGGKCVFIYNSNKNRLEGNSFEGCDIGVHFTAGSEQNGITRNAFVGNRNQVKYVGTRSLDWSENGIGNYWSDNPAFDLNGDGIADAAYRPNDLVDQVVWRHPLAKLLLSSPGVQAVRWAQARFPALYPGGVVDTAPLMRPPPVAALEER